MGFIGGEMCSGCGEKRRGGGGKEGRKEEKGKEGEENGQTLVGIVCLCVCVCVCVCSIYKEI